MIPTLLTAKYDGTCVECGRAFKKGTRIIWSRSDKSTRHIPEQCTQYASRSQKRRIRQRQQVALPAKYR